MSFVAACVQNRAGPDLHESLEDAVALVRDAAGAGASLVCTAELFTCLDMREGALEVGVHLESGHPALPRFRGLARELELWILLGSLAIRDSGGMARNRSYLLTPDGGIAARHDTIHMFDVDLDGGEDRGFVTAYIDLEAVDEARRMIPALAHDRPFTGPAMALEAAS